MSAQPGRGWHYVLTGNGGNVVICWDGHQLGAWPTWPWPDALSEFPAVKTLEEARSEVELRLLGAWA